MNAAGLSDVGKVRNQNQDAIFVSMKQVGPLPNLYIVADGMGGHNAGEVASQRAIECVSGYISSCHADLTNFELVKPDDYMDLMVNAVQDASDVVCDMAEKNPEMAGMGTTLTACVVTEKKAVIAHIGDSRAYTISDDKITQVTADHTFVEDLLASGRITHEEAKNHPKRHVITRALGIKGQFEVDGCSIPLAEVKHILLCSDGLSNMIEDDRLKEIITGLGDAKYRTKLLIDEANLQGGLDNISAIIIDVGR